VDRASAVSEIRQKAAGYGMKNEAVNGMDVMAVRETAIRLVEEIRAGSGPQFLEAHTYRYRGHSMGDPERYRKADEVHRWQEEDPIGYYHKFLVDKDIATDAELNGLDDQAIKEIDDAVEFAEASPNPAPEDLYKNIYADELEG